MAQILLILILLILSAGMWQIGSWIGEWIGRIENRHYQKKREKEYDDI